VPPKGCLACLKTFLFGRWQPVGRAQGGCKHSVMYRTVPSKELHRPTYQKAALRKPLLAYFWILFGFIDGHRRERQRVNSSGLWVIQPLTRPLHSAMTVQKQSYATHKQMGVGVVQ
jgi:hypothetical protein